ncbi:hypothetical protein GOQ27_06910 [Clostridium sp. D2Q-11]|uniref:Uncharacterized protein n=1 Tax=Anaeromonas frigoriresistens TaxID=2683708 RepID=A0A942UXJ9_9FIRM|nr:hypothetical protein [Anaeromonas frigoriresistens]MBS4538186.1 hypothetical protein [Anaeromonas frigoriresistens]
MDERIGKLISKLDTAIGILIVPAVSNQIIREAKTLVTEISLELGNIVNEEEFQETINEDKLEEMKEYLKNTHCSYDKDQVISEYIAGNISYLSNYSLDEFYVEWDGVYCTDLETYTNDVFNNVIQLVCNVIDSYKANNEEVK